MKVNGYEIKNGANLSCADLSDASLRYANLGGANLRGAYLIDANLRSAYLGDANLRGASLVDANLIDANLRSANLSDADLRDANLRGASLVNSNLRDANLGGADLRYTNLRGADLSDANLGGAKLPAFQIPQDGSFTAFKKLREGVVCKLLIPEEARRTASLVGRKCRAEYVFVLEGRGISIHDRDTTYSPGETVRPDSYCDDIRVECAPGIHFFLTREEAENYGR